MTNIQTIQNAIIEIRNQKVLLDSQVAEFYGVKTREINQAIKRNQDKFPTGYILNLSPEEWGGLKSQNVTSKNTLAKGGKVKLPKAFTEKGLYMLATILKSQKATETSLQIIETFAKVREFSQVAKQLATEKEKPKQQNLISKSGELIADILNQEFAGDTESETTIELNLAMIKVKHTIKKDKKNR